MATPATTPPLSPSTPVPSTSWEERDSLLATAVGTPTTEHGNACQDSWKHKPRPATDAIVDRSDRLIATLVGRFTGLVQLATAPEEENATLQTQAAMTLQLQAEMQGLVSLQFNRTSGMVG